MAQAHWGLFASEEWSQRWISPGKLRQLMLQCPWFTAYFSSQSHQVGNFSSVDSRPIQHPPTPSLGQTSVALLRCHRINGKAAFSLKEMPAHASMHVPHWMAQIESTQHQLAGLHTIDPSSSTGPGHPASPPSTTHPQAPRFTKPLAFPVPKDAETPLPCRNAAQLYFAAWKQICGWKRVKWCKVFLIMTVCVWLHLATINLCPYVRTSTAFKHHHPDFTLFWKGASLMIRFSCFYLNLLFRPRQGQGGHWRRQGPSIPLSARISGKLAASPGPPQQSHKQPAHAVSPHLS